MKNNNRTNWDKLRPLNLKIGFIVSLAFVFFAFQVNVVEKIRTPNSGPVIEDLITDSSIPNHREKVHIPPVKPEPEVIKKEILEEFKIETVEKVLVEDEHLFESNEPDEVDYSPVEVEGTGTTAAKVEPIIEGKTDDFILFAPQMPVFGDCSEAFEEEERRLCSNTHLLKYIHSKLRYPSQARQIGIEGNVIAQFTIGKDGKIIDIDIVRDIGGGTKEEVLRVLEEMPIWSPGKQNFKPVNVRITLPVKFKLN